MSEYAAYFSPAGLDGIEALHAASSATPTGPIPIPRGPSRSSSAGRRASPVDATDQRAGSGELFVLEPDAVHTGMAAVPEGWQYKVLYVEPDLLPSWEERDARGPRAARWTVFRDRACAPRCSTPTARSRTSRRAGGGRGRTARGRRPATPPAAGAAAPGGGRGEHAAVRRAVAHLEDHWDAPVPLAELSAVAGLSRFELVRRFGAQIGLTPHAFQTNLRIARARELLAGGVAPAAVAAACGFADQAHLTRTFRSRSA